MIIFDNVSKTYPNGVKGLSHINLTINDGEFVSIIGLSGAGKRTAQDPPQNRHDLTAVQPGKEKYGTEECPFRPSRLLFYMEEYPRSVFQRRL